ncbi:MAG: hypothetical protein BGO70_05825 [Bacteroidetes bacterium 43-93]|nr:T9SS type A sorting domain-containing protein [Bacteroidota bacterium]OJW96914.1 MAG: hypothetical protein BGO70_05825 [Bacteroidetes bacterium 43-93]
MRQILILFFLLSTGLSLYAQIPNASFENWTNHGSYNTPDGWDNRNAQTASAAIFTCQQDTPGTDGNYYMMLISKKIGSSVVNGIAVSGRLDSLTGTPVSGFPYTGRPASLTGKWQYMAFGNDQGYVNMELTKWNTVSNKRDTIGSATYLLPGMVMSWANFSIDIIYTSQATPDSAMIVFSPSNGLNATDNSYIFVDELKFSDFPANVNATYAPTSNIKVYPNPATGRINLDLGRQIAGPVFVNLIDILGKTVRSYSFDGNQQYHAADLSNIAPGLYNAQIHTKTSVTNLTLMIK